MSILMTLQLFFLPKGVIIDNTDKSLTLKFFFARQFSIQVKEIIKFNSVRVISRKGQTAYNGVMIHINNGKDYLLGEFNLEQFEPIQTFLESNNVQFAGDEKFSFVSYFINFFKN
ncbi:MAG TPA: hypothetical protein VKR53_16620 [Puia sp.]|nr:hypothetical protein [Puia sp.]